MYMKICNQCFEPSYSAYQKGEWLCPFCYNDLTKEEPAYIKPGAIPQLIHEEEA